MSRKKRGKIRDWKASFASWSVAPGAGGYPRYAKEEYGNLYEVDPIGDGRYKVIFTTVGKMTSQVRFIDHGGAVANMAVPFKDADSARNAAVAHYRTLRSTKGHPHMLTHAFRSRFRG